LYFNPAEIQSNDEIAIENLLHYEKITVKIADSSKNGALLQQSFYCLLLKKVVYFQLTTK